MMNVQVGLHRIRGAGQNRDRRGTTPYVITGWMVVVAAVGALTFEFGGVSNDQRQAQLATNRAAVAAAGNLMRAEGVAVAAVSDARLAPNTEMTVVRGRYRNDPMLPKEERFQPDPVNANAARVTVRAEAPLHVGRLFTGTPSYSILAEATATNAAFGAIAINGRTLAPQDGLLNPILSGLLGARLDLGPADYRSLAGTRIDLFRYVQALAAELSLTSASYDRVVRQSVSVPAAIAALARAARSDDGAGPAAGDALEMVAAAALRAPGGFVISSLFSPGPYGAQPVSERPTGTAMTVSALDLLNAIAQSASISRQVEAEVTINAPGIVGATVRFAFAERPASMSWIRAGAEGVNIQTVQMRAFVNLKLQGVGAIKTLQLPIAIEVTNAMAQISSIRCDHLQPALSKMTVDARPGSVEAWIGEPAEVSFANMTSALKPGPARIVDLPVLRVSGRASLSANKLHPNTLSFTQGEAQMRLAKSVGARDFTSSLVTRLLQQTQFALEKRDAVEGMPTTPTKVVGEILNAAQPSIERALATTLDAMGIAVGRVDVTPVSLRCDGAILVQ